MSVVSCVGLKKKSLYPKTKGCENGWAVSTEISSGTSYGVVYQACCAKDCKYILKYQKYNITDYSKPIITENTIKNEVEMQSLAADHDLAPDVYDSWVCEEGGVIIMAAMKRSVGSLFAEYKSEPIRKMIIDNVFKLISKLHSLGVIHGDAHLDNIMVTYSTPGFGKDELSRYNSFDYVYKFIDFGVSEHINEREKFKQIIGDYSKASDWLGLEARKDKSLESIAKYAEDKTMQLSIEYGLIRAPEEDDSEDWSDDD